MYGHSVKLKKISKNLAQWRRLSPNVIVVDLAPTRVLSLGKHYL